MLAVFDKWSSQPTAIINPAPHRKPAQPRNSISGRLRALVLLALMDKNGKAKELSAQEALLIWHARVKVQKWKKEVMLRAMGLQRVCENSFLARIKLECLRAHQREEREEQQIKLKQTQMERLRIEKEREQRLAIQYDNGSQSQSQNSSSEAPVPPQPIPACRDSQAPKLGGHLRCISEQPSMPGKSEYSSTQFDVLEQFDDRLNAIRTRLQVSGLRSCELVLGRLGEARKLSGFKCIQNFASHCEKEKQGVENKVN